MRYKLYFPTPDKRGSTMLDYIMGERPVDRSYECVYEGTVDEYLVGSALLNFLWQRHNEGDNLDGNRPLAQEIRSMCIGDIIWFPDGRRAWVVERDGFTEIWGAKLPVMGGL